MLKGRVNICLREITSADCVKNANLDALRGVKPFYSKKIRVAKLPQARRAENNMGLFHGRAPGEI